MQDKPFLPQISFSHCFIIATGSKVGQWLSMQGALGILGILWVFWTDKMPNRKSLMGEALLETAWSHNSDRKMMGEVSEESQIWVFPSYVHSTTARWRGWAEGLQRGVGDLSLGWEPADF